MTIEYIVSRSGTYHIPLYNYENKFCYWLSILQRLHTSNTLNRCVIDYFSNNRPNQNIESILLKPVYLYALFDGSDVTNSNIIRIYDAIRSYLIEYIPQVVHVYAKNGYLPELLLVQYYSPIIFHLFRDSFVSIMDEIHVNKIEFEPALSTVEDAMRVKNQFLKNDEDQKYMFNLYKSMSESIAQNIESFKLEPFVSATLEVYPNKDHTGGHAITLLYGVSNIDPDNEMFYIIDDQRSISPLHTYYTNRNERVHEISLRDVTDVTVANINNVLHTQASIDPNCKFSQRVTRYSLSFEDNFLSPSDELIKSEFRNKAASISDLHVRPIAPSQPQPSQQRNATSLTPNTDYRPIQPSTSQSTVWHDQAFSLFIIGLIIGAIIGLIVASVNIKNKSRLKATQPYRQQIQ